MCIIAIKRKGLDLNKEYVKNCFSNNPDGAGFMYADNGKVHIEKGFFDVNKYIARLDELWDKKDLSNKNLVMHFRIATNGAVNSQNCHPFPISKKLKDLRKTEVDSRYGIVHNGVISKYSREVKMSDTQKFIMNDVYRLWMKNNIEAMEKDMKGNGRFCILKGDGEFELFGQFDFEKDGWIFSNSSWSYSYEDLLNYKKHSKGSTTSYPYSSWDYGYYDEDNNGFYEIMDEKYDNFDTYFKTFFKESEPLNDTDFKNMVHTLYVMTAENYVELESDQWLIPEGKYAIDQYGVLYYINWKEKRVTCTYENVREIF